MTDAAKARWLTNETVVKIVYGIVIMMFVGTVLVMNKYWELKAADIQITQQHELFKQSVESKLDIILEKLEEIKDGK
jgi:hypothetical protein